MVNINNQVFIRDLCTLSDAAARLELPTTRLNRWAERRKTTGFPEPIYAHNKIAIYDFPDITRWVKLWNATRRGNS